MAALLGASSAPAVEVTPLYNLQVLGGQYFFKSEKGSLTGNVSGTVAPAVKFDDRWAVLPSVSSSYQGTKQVVDLVGSGSIFQEQMDHRAALRLFYTPGGAEGKWRIKPNTSFKWELLKETKDEDWTKGLFDYYKWSLGAEAEYVYQDPHSVRFGFDYFETSFPNYTSLESAAAAGLARELVGDRVLDTRNYMGSFGISVPVSEYSIIEGSAYGVYQDFHKQHIVDDSGALTAKFRKDVLSAFGVAARTPGEFNKDVRFLGGVDFGFSYNASNQNSYDAQRVKFMKYHYNYGELRAGPSFSLYVGPRSRPVVFGIGGQWSYRWYPHRERQDEKGTYIQDDHVKTHSYMSSISLSYPMGARFSLVFNFQYGTTVSTQMYEQYYSYNYTVKNYLFGFRYEY